MRSIFRDKNNQIDRIHYVGEAGEPAFANGWANYDVTWSPAKFWIDPFGVVHLDGLIKSGTLGADIFILPAGYRPKINLLFPSVSNNGIGRINVYPSGSVQTDVNVGSNVWYTLSGITFRIG